jgi:hypothetical protein
MAIMLSVDDTIQKIADILGVPKTARNWGFTANLTEAVEVWVEYMPEINKGDLVENELKLIKKTYRLEEIK